MFQLQLLKPKWTSIDKYVNKYKVLLSHMQEKHALFLPSLFLVLSQYTELANNTGLLISHISLVYLSFIRSQTLALSYSWPLNNTGIRGVGPMQSEICM